MGDFAHAIRRSCEKIVLILVCVEVSVGDERYQMIKDVLMGLNPCLCGS